jgi:hypothetical protein
LQVKNAIVLRKCREITEKSLKRHKKMAGKKKGWKRAEKKQKRAGKVLKKS